MKKLIVAALMAGTVMPLGSTARAQSVEQEAGASDEIVVTARRREERLQDVPIAVTAIDGDELAKRAIYNENDLQSAVPGLVIRSNGGEHSFNYVIRGQSVDTYTNSPPSVLPYINEVQIVSHSSSAFYDMAGIQVLKGPQGTLFGRNATGGAVLYETAKPTNTFEGFVVGRYGNHNRLDVEGAINVPISEDAALRVAASYTRGGAYVEDYFTDEEYGNLERFSIRGSLKISPAAGITNTTVVQHTNEDGTNTPFLLWSAYPCGATNNGIPLVTAPGCDLTVATNPGFANFLAANPAVFQGNIADAVALQRSLGPWQNLSDVFPYHEAKSTWAINTTVAELTPSLTLKNIFGYNRTTSDDGYDFDGSPWPYFEIHGDLMPNGKMSPVAGYALKTRQISNEFQLQGKAFDNRLDYVLGLYYLDQRFSVVSNDQFWNFSSPAFRFIYTATTKTRSVAGFAQATYKLTDQLNLTGGFRYTWDKTTMVQLPGSLWLLFGFPNNPETQKASKPSWTVSLDYRLTPELMVYVAQRGSWRSGSYNFSTPPINDVAANGGNKFLPETTYDAEVGIKYSGNGLGVPVTFNADVYQQWVKNIQRAVYILTPAGVSLLTGNVPRAKITGVEVDFTVRPTEQFSFGASGTYTNARYTRNSVVLGFTDNPQTPANESTTVNYGPFADVPKWAGTIFAEYTMPLGGDTGDLTLRVDAYAQSKQFFSNVADTLNPDTILPSYHLVNARLTWSGIMGSKVDASIFARNLFNEKYFIGGNAGQSGGLPNSVNSGRPRFWGGEVRVGF